MKNITKVLLIVIYCLVTNHTLADFELGSNYYTQKKFEQAFKEFSEAAKYGDHDAQNNIGVMYYRGEFVSQDKAQAYAWMALATQDPSYKEAGTQLKIFNKFNDQEKLLAELKQKEIFTEYNDQAILDRITPTFTGASNSVKPQRPLKKVVPEFPPVKDNDHVSGFVDVLFTIDKDGLTKDHFVYYSTSKYFTAATITAMRKWRYEPLHIASKSVSVTGEKQRFKFSFEDTKADTKKIIKMANDLKKKAEQGNAENKLSYGFFLDTIPSFAPDVALPDNPNNIYLQSALAGNSIASYFLGRNVLNGNMCTSDSVKSMGWLLKSAKSGLADAEFMLAVESFSGARFEKNEDKGIYWLSKAAPKYKPAALNYAWILSTHPNQDKRNAKLAAELIAKIDDDYLDKRTLFKTRAAVAAENGDFATAIQWQKKAIDDAKEFELPAETLQQQLDFYTAQKPWREEI